MFSLFFFYTGSLLAFVWFTALKSNNCQIVNIITNMNNILMTRVITGILRYYFFSFEHIAVCQYKRLYSLLAAKNVSENVFRDRRSGYGFWGSSFLNIIGYHFNFAPVGVLFLTGSLDGVPFFISAKIHPATRETNHLLKLTKHYVRVIGKRFRDQRFLCFH